MVASVSTSTSTSQTSADALASATNQSLGKQDFLNLLIAQLKNQDPLQPQDDSAFVAQLAQFSSLEQQMQTNTSLTQIATQLQGQTNAQLASLLGTNATVQGSSVTLASAGSTAPITFDLSSASAGTQITIQDSNGNAIRTLSVGAKPAGISQVLWDGRSDAGDPQPAGSYSVSVTATSTNGAPVSVSQNITGKVLGISFSGGSASVNLDNGVSAPASQLVQVQSASSGTANASTQ